MTTPTRRIDRVATDRLVAMTALALALMVGGLAVATASFEESGIAADLFAVQLAFDPDVIRAQYEGLLARGTFDVYVRTQVLDYLFIVGLGGFGWLLHALVGRVHVPGSRWHRVARIGGRLVVTSAALDAVENLVSFAMLADPAGFPELLAPIYSSIAAAKWLIALVGAPLLVTELVAAAVRLATTRRVVPGVATS